VERWKEGAQLYDEEEDPQELANLAEDPAQSEVIANPKAGVKKNWQQRVIG